jgi:hypothetical protein
VRLGRDEDFGNFKLFNFEDYGSCEAAHTLAHCNCILGIQSRISHHDTLSLMSAHSISRRAYSEPCVTSEMQRVLQDLGRCNVY